MKRTIIITVSILAIVLLLLGGYVVFRVTTTLSKENITETVELPGCIMIPGPVGPEDFEYLEKEHGLVVSSINRQALSDTTGKLYWIELGVPPEQQVAEPIDIAYPERFRPHGITFQRTETGGKLFVISHPLTGEFRHTIEVFTLKSSAGSLLWEHKQTLKDPLLSSPNDLVALQDGTLFIANDFEDIGGFAMQAITVLLERKQAPIVYYDGEQFHCVGANVISSPGIGYRQENEDEFLYQSDFMHKAVQKLRIRRTQNTIPTLELVETISLVGGPDNFTRDTENNLYVATHYSTGLIVEHGKNPAILSPTQIVRIRLNGEQHMIYANKGEEISAGSVGAVIGERLYIGQIQNEGILSCPMK
jgi:hypothetical protein